MQVRIAFRKALSVIANLRQNARYHYEDSPFAVVRYLYVALFRINRFHIVFNDLRNNPAAFSFEAPYRVETPDARALSRIYSSSNLPREFNYGDTLGLRLCFLLYCHDEIALMEWVSLPGDYSRFFVLEDYTAELYYVTTLPKFRGESLSGKMALYVSSYLREKGYQKLVVCINEENVASIKPLTRRGFKVIKTVRAIGPFNRKLKL